jgi:hypothetical protein
MSTDLTSERRTADRLDIADTMYRYAEAMDRIGAHPVERGAPDPALAQATEILRTCMTDDAIVRLYFHGPVDEPVQAGPGGRWLSRRSSVGTSPHTATSRPKNSSRNEATCATRARSAR